jgi:hypothetical protein
MMPTSSPPPVYGTRPCPAATRSGSLVVLGVLLVLDAACARMRDGHGNAWAHHELTVIHDVDPPSTTGSPPSEAPAASSPRFSELILAGTRGNALLGTRHVGYHIGADLSFGSTLRAGGFAYDLALFPLGAGLRLGATSALMLGAGIGASGAVGSLDDAITFPIELTGEFDAGRARLLARGRLTYLAAAPGRARGAPTTSLADETEAMLALRIGHHYDSYGFPTGNGYFAGIAYRELLGARFLGLTIGYSLDVATRAPYRTGGP